MARYLILLALAASGCASSPDSTSRPDGPAAILSAPAPAAVPAPVGSPLSAVDSRLAASAPDGGVSGLAETAAGGSYQDGIAGGRPAAAGEPSAPLLPGLSDYRLGAQDVIEVSVFGVEELSGSSRVNSRGLITLPLIGQIRAAGLTSEELAAKLKRELERDYLQQADVTVSVTEYGSQRLTVEGAVERPGIYILNNQTSLLQGIALAQGLGPLADPSNVTLFRLGENGERLSYQYDLDRIRSGEIADPVLQGSDVLVVQRSGGRTFLRDSIFRDAIDLINPFSRLPF